MENAFHVRYCAAGRFAGRFWGRSEIGNADSVAGNANVVSQIPCTPHSLSYRTNVAKVHII